MLHSDWLRTFLGNLSKSITFLNIYGVDFQKENKNFKNFYLKSNDKKPGKTFFNHKNFQKTWPDLFQQIWVLIFVYFYPHAKSQKNLIQMYHVRDPQRDEQTDKKQIFYWTATLETGPINQVDNDCFWTDCFDPNLSTIAFCPNFWENS